MLKYAHSLEGKPPSEWQTLDDHLKGVAAKAREFAEPFGAGEWGEAAGGGHDLGKGTPSWQEYLFASAAGKKGLAKVPHSIQGAKLAVERHPDYGKILAYVIAGHHAGLADGKSNDDSCLTRRLKWATVPDLPHDLPQYGIPTGFPFTQVVGRTGFQLSFFIRMLFSCLVDADFLNTEKFLDKNKHVLRGAPLPLEILWERLHDHLAEFTKKTNPSPVDPWRAKVLDWCLEASSESQGLFSLTVPTGGGKTLSSLAFALNHAITHKLKRIIYVIPYTSIIEQNANVFREAVGADAVIEHHSNFDMRRKKENDEEEDPTGDEILAARHDLATENWDAPVVVTTSVQFFESLYANRASKCRKLHNIAQSVVILDEAQMLPQGILRPCIEALRELTATYRTTVVLCTATQPALTRSNEFSIGLNPPTEIVKDVSGLFIALRRTRVVHLGLLTDEALAARLEKHAQVLCVVNTRRHARLLCKRLKGVEGVFHLSAAMCPAHRTQKLDAIREALKAGRPCRVVSTQLIECGVHVSFPVVYRAAAGLDSVIQAGGRCNREGELPERGMVYVFEAVDVPTLRGEMSRAAAVGVGIMERFADILSPEAVEAYFRTMYWLAGLENLDARVWDHKGDVKVRGIFDAFQQGGNTLNFPFRKVAEAFRFIESVYQPVIIPWDKDGEEIVRGLEHAEHTGGLARRAQRYTVQIPPWEFVVLERDGALLCLQDRFFVLVKLKRYDPEMGLNLDDDGPFRSEDWIV